MQQEIRYSISLFDLEINTAKDFTVMHFAEHIKFEGFKKISKLSLVFQKAEQLGGEISANTSRTGLHFKLTFLEEFYDEAKLLLDSLVFNTIPNLSHFEAVKKELIAELDDDGPSMHLTDKMFKKNFQGVYIFPDGGIKKLIKEVTKEDVVLFFDKIDKAKKYFISSLDPESSAKSLNNLDIEFPTLKKSWENLFLIKNSTLALESYISKKWIEQADIFSTQKIFQDKLQDQIWIGRSVLPGHCIMSFFIGEEIDLMKFYEILDELDASENLPENYKQYGKIRYEGYLLNPSNINREIWEKAVFDSTMNKKIEG